MTDTRKPQELFGDETLEQALRQLTLYGHDGLPVVSHDRAAPPRLDHPPGCAPEARYQRQLLRRRDRARRRRSRLRRPGPRGTRAYTQHTLAGYEIVEITITPESPALGRPAGNIAWPPGSVVVAIGEGHEIVPVRNDTELHAGERIILLAPAASQLHPS